MRKLRLLQDQAGAADPATCVYTDASPTGCQDPTIFYLESVPGPKTKVLGEGLGHCPRPAILGLGRCLGRRAPKMTHPR